MTVISNEDVLKLARLSMIQLQPDEVAKFRDELEAIVKYVELLGDVDVEGLLPTNQVTGLVNVMRTDEVQSTVSTEELLKNLPDRQDNYIKVKRVLD